MVKKIIIDSYINYDGILSQDERKKILNKIESAFNWVGASIPDEIELDGKKFNLRKEIQNLILKEKLTYSENNRIKNLISSLEAKQQFLTDIIKKEDIPDYDALELSNKICGILRAVHDLRDLVNKAPKSQVINAKQELMKNIEDKKRWLKFVKKIE